MFQGLTLSNERPLDHTVSTPATELPSPTGSEHPLRSSLERYTVKGEKGRGGIGRVLIAFDEEIGREIALKELVRPEGGATSAAIIRFLREARVTGQLEHPGIVPVYEIGHKEDGTPYYTMRLVRGETLSVSIRSAKSLSERLRLLPHFRDLCNAVAYAHSRGVIHRDIKPDNIMIGEFGETILLDWGLAKVKGQSDERANEMAQGISSLRTSSLQQTMSGKPLGTPAYMAPEQARGLITEIDERSDIYALGAVLYEILTGDPPFEGQNAADILAKVITDEPLPITALEPDAPPDLCAVVAKTLAKKKEDRYSSAREVAHEIETYMAGGRIGVYEYSAWELLKRFVRKNRALSLLIAALILVFIVGVTIIFLAWRNAIESERIAHLNLALGYQENAERMLHERRYDKAEIYAAAALRHNPWNPRSPYCFSDIEKRSSSEQNARTLSARSSLYLARMNQNDGLVAAIPRRGAEVRALDISPDGSIAAFAQRDGTIVLWDIQERKDSDRLFGHRDEVTEVSFSPDGKTIASASWDKTVRLWDTKTRTELVILRGHTEEVYAVCWSSDGSTLISGGNDGILRFWEVSKRREAGSVPLGEVKIRAVALSPDGETAAAGTTAGEIYLVHRGTISRYRPHTESITAIRWRDSSILYTASYDKKALVFDPIKGKPIHTLSYWDAFFAMDVNKSGKVALASRDTTILLWDPLAGKTEQFHGHDGAVETVSFAPDGEMFISTGTDSVVRIWKSTVKRQSRTFEGHRTYIPAIAIAPDGMTLASASWDRTVKLWDVAQEREISSFACSEACLTVAFHPYDTLLAIAGQNRRILLLNSSSGAIIATLEGHDDSVSSIAFSPDGSLLASASWDRTVRLWNIAQRRPIQIFSSHTGAVNAVAFSPDGRLLASAGRDKLVMVHSTTAKEPLMILTGHTAAIPALAYSSDGRIIASAGEEDVTILHRVADGGIVHQFKTSGASVTALSFSPDGRYLLAVGKQAFLWETATENEVLRLPLVHTGYAATFSRDGRYFALSEGTLIRLYPTQFDIWEKDPTEILRGAERRLWYRLEGFHMVVTESQGQEQ